MAVVKIIPFPGVKGEQGIQGPTGPQGAPGPAILTFVTVPTSPTSTGTKGQVAEDASYFYICIATNTWKRIAYSTWNVGG